MEPSELTGASPPTITPASILSTLSGAAPAVKVVKTVNNKIRNIFLIKDISFQLIISNILQETTTNLLKGGIGGEVRPKKILAVWVI